MGKSTINGPFSIAMLVHQRVTWQAHLSARSAKVPQIAGDSTSASSRRHAPCALYAEVSVFFLFTQQRCGIHAQYVGILASYSAWPFDNHTHI